MRCNDTRGIGDQGGIPFTGNQTPSTEKEFRRKSPKRKEYRVKKNQERGPETMRKRESWPGRGHKPLLEEPGGR